jgi:hypothetical protein
MIKDYRRNSNVVRIQNDKIAWDICRKYTQNLNKILNKDNIDVLVENLYIRYILNLKSNNLQIYNKKYIECWNVLINTLKNKKNSSNTKKKSILQLHYISQLNI